MLNLQTCFLHSSKKPTCPLLKSGHAQLNHKHILDQNLKAATSQTVFLQSVQMFRSPKILPVTLDRQQ